MRKLLVASLLMLGGGAFAQTQVSEYRPGVTEEGAVYFLPKTVLRFVVQVEKTTYTPGEFCKYAGRYLRMNGVGTEPSVSYKVNTINMTTYGEADKSKCYAVKFNAKTAASNVVLSDGGVLLAVNAQASKPVEPAEFRPARRPAAVNPKQYLSEEILAAGSTAKMAELTAQEIYDIRESKNELNRGEADYMPKDGEQLRIMLANLTAQDNALTQLFTGSTVRDTIEYVLTMCPDKEIDRQVLFRLSQKLGLVENDDLSGEPYYITLTDGRSVPQAPAGQPEGKKKKSAENGIYVNVPGKITVSISQGGSELGSFDTYAGQFGNTELLSGELFNKRYTTHLTLNPATGGIDKLEAEQPE